MQYSSRTPWPKKKQMCAQEQFFTGKAGDMGKFPIAECSIHHELLGHKKKMSAQEQFFMGKASDMGKFAITECTFMIHS